MGRTWRNKELSANYVDRDKKVWQSEESERGQDPENDFISVLGGNIGKEVGGKNSLTS